MGQGRETELPKPPGYTSRPCVDAGCCPDPEPLTVNVRGWQRAAQRPQGIPNQSKPPGDLACPQFED